MAGSPITSSVALDCGTFIDRRNSLSPGFEDVLGVVALPTSSRTAALQTSATPGADPAVRLFAKTGLLIRAGTTFELVVPDEAKDLVSIGWGKGPGTPSRRVTVSCPAGAASKGWLAYAGGYYLVHVHLVDFQILSRNGKPPMAHEKGPKDVVYVGEGETVKVIARYGPQIGRYMIHCHNLAHEDHDMMDQFEVGTGGLDPITAAPPAALPAPVGFPPAP